MSCFSHYTFFGTSSLIKKCLYVSCFDFWAIFFLLQTLTPKMQPLGDDTNANNSIGKLLGPASSNQQQGNFSINLWRIAFHDAFKRLCPVRAGCHDCGCLPALARMV